MGFNAKQLYLLRKALIVMGLAGTALGLGSAVVKAQCYGCAPWQIQQQQQQAEAEQQRRRQTEEAYYYQQRQQQGYQQPQQPQIQEVWGAVAMTNEQGLVYGAWRGNSADEARALAVGGCYQGFPDSECRYVLANQSTPLIAEVASDDVWYVFRTNAFQLDDTAASYMETCKLNSATPGNCHLKTILNVYAGFTSNSKFQCTDNGR